MSARRRRNHAFRRRDALHNWSLHFGPNMTPMVDVVMVILVFFMASAAFIGSQWFLKAAVVPEAKAAPTTPPPPPAQDDPFALPPARVHVTLETSETGETLATALDQTRVPLEDFLVRVAAMPRGAETSALEVLVQPAASVPYNDVIRVHEAYHAVGVTKVGIGVAHSSPILNQ